MKTRFFSLALLLTLVLALGVSASDAPLSLGVEVIRADTRLIKCCVNGESVTFNESEFTALTGSKLRYITIESLPRLSDGVLKLAGVDVIPGQSISASALEFLKFVPASSYKATGAASAFGFSAVCDAGWGNGVTLECVIRFSETANFAPVAVSAAVSTYENVGVKTSLKPADADSDLNYVIQSYPKNGTVCVSADGVASYTPKDGFRGIDSFRYYITDSWGKKSETATVLLDVSKNKSGIYFADMGGSDGHLAAIKAAEREMAAYAQIGDSYYFSPDTVVSRMDFTVMLLSAAGIPLPEKQYPTDIYTDTSALSETKRLYIETAVTSGVIKVEEAMFRPDEPILVREALTMAEKLLGDKEAGITGGPGALTKKEAAELLYSIFE